MDAREFMAQGWMFTDDEDVERVICGRLHDADDGVTMLGGTR
jgi:hypothetical protein